MAALTTPEIAEAVAQGGPAWTGLDGAGNAIGAAGIVPWENGAWCVWALFSERIAGRGLALVRCVRAVLDAWPAPLVAIIWPEHGEAARFARVLGFRYVRPCPVEGVGEAHLYARSGA